MTNILTGVRCYLTVILICISLIISDIEHFLVCLLAIWICSLEKCLFRSFTHFSFGWKWKTSLFSFLKPCFPTIWALYYLNHIVNEFKSLPVVVLVLVYIGGHLTNVFLSQFPTSVSNIISCDFGAGENPNHRPTSFLFSNNVPAISWLLKLYFNTKVYGIKNNAIEKTYKENYVLYSKLAPQLLVGGQSYFFWRGIWFFFLNKALNLWIHLLKQQMSTVGKVSITHDGCSTRMKQLSGRVNPHINADLLPFDFFWPILTVPTIEFLNVVGENQQYTYWWH